MDILNKPLSFYIEKLKKKEYFSLVMYGDGEWEAIFKNNIGGKNAEGSIYTPELCDALEKSLYFKADNFFFSTAGQLLLKIKNYLIGRKLDIDFYEKEVWNEAGVKAELYPLINQLRKMRVVIVGNNALRKLSFLNYNHFIEVSYPNCFVDKERVIKECLEYGKPAVYLFSVGLPNPIFIQELHGKIPESWFVAVGSIWDTFVRIGGQRGFRQELYSDEVKYQQWLKDNLKELYENYQS